METHKNSFNFYESFGSIIEAVYDWDNKLLLFWMIYNYGIYRIEPELNEHNEQIYNLFYGSIKDSLDKDWKRYDEWVEKRKK